MISISGKMDKSNTKKLSILNVWLLLVPYLFAGV